MAEGWQLYGFIEKLNEWATAEQAPPDLRSAVADWLIELQRNPYAIMRPQRGFPDLWFCGVPGTSDGLRMVVCAVRINLAEHKVMCDRIGSLSLPIEMDPEPLIDPEEPID